MEFRTQESIEPGHEKMCLMSYANNKGADQPAHSRSLISAFVVRCLDSIISRFYSRNFKTLASFCGCAGRFVSGLVGNSRKHVLSCRGSLIWTMLIPDIPLGHSPLEGTLCRLYLFPGFPLAPEYRRDESLEVDQSTCR